MFWQEEKVCFTSSHHINIWGDTLCHVWADLLMSPWCFTVASCHRWWKDRDGWRMRPWLVVRDDCGGLVAELIQTWPKTREETTKQPAGKPQHHLKTEYQMKQTEILPRLHYTNCLGESIWWIMKRLLFLSPLLPPQPSSLSLLSPPFLMLSLMNSSVLPSTSSILCLFFNVHNSVLFRREPW